ncbi:hypothetical protein ABZ721_39470 [Streptomyces sp. NPDC006733]|uniref:hypothetical protein n=1 Tax=Streptomyces sp. NPDC006733 TaxID=3155460 RepID=UPI00340072F6
MGFVVVIGVAGAATGDKEDKAAAASPTTTAAQPAGKQPAATSAPASHAAAPKPKPKPKAQTVLSVSGSGMKSTATFKVEDDWDLQYSYDCSAFGVQGNFIVKQGGDLGDIYLNELGAKGSDVTHLHDGGSMHLEVTSECKWTIKVIDLP